LVQEFHRTIFFLSASMSNFFENWSTAHLFLLKYSINRHCTLYKLFREKEADISSFQTKPTKQNRLLQSNKLWSEPKKIIKLHSFIFTTSIMSVYRTAFQTKTKTTISILNLTYPKAKQRKEAKCQAAMKMSDCLPYRYANWQEHDTSSHLYHFYISMYIIDSKERCCAVYIIPCVKTPYSLLTRADAPSICY
jgi:hypothetical protein